MVFCINWHTIYITDRKLHTVRIGQSLEIPIPGPLFQVQWMSEKYIQKAKNLR